MKNYKKINGEKRPEKTPTNESENCRGWFRFLVNKINLQSLPASVSYTLPSPALPHQWQAFFWLAMSLPLFMSKALKIFHAFLWPVGEMQIECETKPLNMQQTDTEPYNRQIVACCLLFVACLLPSEGGSATYRISISLQCQVQRFTEGTSLYTISINKNDAAL